MARVIIHNQEEFVSLITTGPSKLLGFGGDGECYLKNDGYVYKNMNSFNYTEFHDEITQEEIPSDYILFPESIYLYEGTVVGNRCKYVANDKLLEVGSDLTDEDYEGIINAIPTFVDEITKLSDNLVYMFDLANNLMFDGNYLYAIDTDNYQIRSDSTPEEIYSLNIDILEYALRMEFSFANTRNKEAEENIFKLIRSYLPKERAL